MQLINAPSKIVLPFGSAGAKNTIPVASQIGVTPGAASFTDGFPPLTRTPLSAGGIPPSGLDMNGILYDVSAIILWANAGAGYPYDASFATNANVGGYPKGSQILRSDGKGYWLNTTDNNTNDPEASGAIAAGWTPFFTSGAAAVVMTNANVTLTNLQYGQPIIQITGTLVANLNLVFPDSLKYHWVVINQTTGAYTITCKTASGTGVTVTGTQVIASDGVNISAASGGGSSNGITKLAANTTFYISNAGSDSTGNGTSGNPWATLQYAWNYIANNYNAAGYTVTIQMADGTYAALNATIPIAGTSPQSVIINGDNTTPTNVVVSSASTSIAASYFGVGFTITNFKTTSSGANCVNAYGGGTVIVGSGMNFGTAAIYQLLAQYNSHIVCTSNYTISGGAACHMAAAQNSSFEYGTQTVTLTGTPAFANSFALSFNASTMSFSSTVFSGAATGVRYNAYLGGQINTNGAGASYLPGNSAGTTATGGNYV